MLVQTGPQVRTSLHSECHVPHFGHTHVHKVDVYSMVKCMYMLTARYIYTYVHVHVHTHHNHTCTITLRCLHQGLVHLDNDDEVFYFKCGWSHAHKHIIILTSPRQQTTNDALKPPISTFVHSFESQTNNCFGFLITLNEK